jgi:uncharacterized pyridoxamine 5'-phosphate oxidase family protein
MATRKPVTELDARYSSPDASATDWTVARDHLERAEIFWLTTVRPDGRPHVTPVLAVWLDGSLYFCTGPTERKARNLAQNPHAVLTTGRNTFEPGLDLMVEGDAPRVTDTTLLRRIAAAYEEKYGPEWHWEVDDGAFRQGEHGRAFVFSVTPSRAYGFGRGHHDFSHTRWRFDPGHAA